MKQRTIFVILAVFGLTLSVNAQDNVEIPTAPKEYRRPEGYNPVPHRYKYSLNELKDKYSEKMMLDAAKEYDRIYEVNGRGKWKPSGTSLDRHRAPEWFEDIKFGMFIDWGLWSVGGWAEKKETGGMYPDWYEQYFYTGEVAKKYHVHNWGEGFERDDLIPFFKAERYQPEKLVDMAIEAGMKYIVPFCKHHSGFCLWPSSYTHRDVGDMLGGKDLVKPLVDDCRKKGLKFGFYFSTDEWEYPVILDNEINVRKWTGKYEKYTPLMENIASGKIAVRDFAKDYIIPQAVEFIDRYDPDILWYDGEWETPVEFLGAYDIAAYFYNHAEGRKEVAVNDRYGQENGKRLRDRRGDFYTKEFSYGQGYDSKSHHAWEENRGISQSFGFNWQDTDKNVLSSEKFLEMFLDIVSHGGNLLLIVNLDAQGALPDIQEKRLKDIGKWLKVNGEGIYFTRAYSTAQENNVRYTRSKDCKTVYAISMGFPGAQLELKSVKPADGSKVYMLGYDKPLKWSHKNGTTTISLPAELLKDANRPCSYAYTFKIKN